MRCTLAFGGLLALVLIDGRIEADASSPSEGSRTIDEYLQGHWDTQRISPAAECTDATFLRRITLDLAGRIPTREEVEQFLADGSRSKRMTKIDSLLNSPEFAAYFAYVFDDFVQGPYAGNEPFLGFLRVELKRGTSWKDLFTLLILGPWDNDEHKPANRFLDKRAKDLNFLTVDTTRVFFGVDISCAQCHDHPLVDDWKQNHYYGMASFFNRTTGGKGKVGEKKEGEVKFLGSNGQEQTAKPMFLSGSVVLETEDSPEEKGSVSRREQLVRIALEEKTFFSRAFVNQIWQEFFGRGLVHPIDQMHSGNAPSVPGLLEALSQEFETHDYNIRWLVRAIVSSAAYQKSSVVNTNTAADKIVAGDFAVAQLRPLRPRQLAFSLLIATENITLSTPLAKLEKKAAPLAPSFDPRNNDFRSSTNEALFLSNNKAVQELLISKNNNLVEQLLEKQNSPELIEIAVASIHCRPATEAERLQLTQWLAEQPKRPAALRNLLWALLTSAEFRFIH